MNLQSHLNRVVAILVLGLGLTCTGLKASGIDVQWKWGQSFVGTALSEVVATTVDSTGMLYVVGNFSGTLPVGKQTQVVSKGKRDFFVAKMSSQGNVIWATSFGGSNDDIVRDIALDQDGSIVIIGTFRSAQITMLQYTLTNSSSGPDSTSDVFVAKLRPDNGATLWASSVQGEGNDFAEHIIHRRSGGFAVAGEFESFEFTLGSKTLLPVGKKDVFVATLNSDGTWGTSASMGGHADEFCNAIAEDNQGNIIVGGEFASNDMRCGQQQLISQGLNDAWLAVVTANGQISTATSFGTVEDESIAAIAVGSDNSIVVQGGFRARHLSIGSLNCDNHSDAGTDCFVYTTNAQFVPRSLMSYGGDLNETPAGVTVLLNGDCIVALNSNSPSITTESNKVCVGAGAIDLVLMRIDANGNCLSISSFGGSEDDKIQCLNMQPNGIIVIGGLFASPTMGSANTIMRGSSTRTPSGFVASFKNIPIEHVPSYCDWNIVRNGSFTQGSIKGGVLGKETSTDYWVVTDLSPINNTPNLHNQPGCYDNWYVSLHGSAAVGEVIHQNVSLVKGKDYEISFCAKRYPTQYETAPKIRFIASNTSLKSVTDVAGSTLVISESVTSYFWTTYTMKFNASTTTSILSICVTNDNADNKPSLGAIDNICIHEVIPCLNVQSVTSDTLCCIHQVVLNNVSGYAVSSIAYSLNGGIVNSITAGACSASVDKNPDSKSGTIAFGSGCTKSIPLTVDIAPSTESGDATLVLEVAYALRGTCTLPIKLHCPGKVVHLLPRPTVAPSIERDPRTFDSRTINIHNVKFPGSAISAIHIRPSNPLNGALVDNVIVDGKTVQVDPSLLDLDLRQSNGVDESMRFTVSIPRNTQWAGTLSIVIETGLHDSDVVEIEPWIVKPSANAAFVSREHATHPQVLMFRAANPDRTRSVAWVRVSLPDASASIIAAQSASDTMPLNNSNIAVITESLQSNHGARFQFNQAIAPGDSTPRVCIVAQSNSTLPIQPIISLYDEGGNLIAVDTATMDQIISGVDDEQQITSPHTGLNASVQPNPVRNNCNVAVNSTTTQELRYSLLDIQGNLIQEETSMMLYSGSNSLRIDLSSVASGQYFVRLRTSQNVIAVPLTVVK